jgi:hypothetical protein
VDYNSVESLTSALQGQDAVVSTVGSTAIEGQKILIDAAIAAGVKRFIPSEFGSCTTHPELQGLPHFSELAGIRQYLVDHAKAGALSYTVLACGAFLEVALKIPVLVNFDKHTAVLLDGGNNRMSCTSLDSVGKAIAGILKNLDKTRNRILHVSQVILTQNTLLNIAREVKPELEWSTSAVKSSDLLQQGLDAFAAKDFSFPSILKLLSGTAGAGDRYGSAYDETDNELLGIDIITQERLKTLVTERLG